MRSELGPGIPGFRFVSLTISSPGATALASITATRKTVVLVGNPNTGKSTLFNGLTGFRQRVANYPGVTVEKRSGRLRVPGGDHVVDVIDLPGAYSLSPRSEDEAIVLDVLLGRMTGVAAPDLIVAVVDAANLARNLFLTTQLLELGKPVVVALNMIDQSAAAGLCIDAEALGRELGVPVTPVIARTSVGVPALMNLIIASLEKPSGESRFVPLPEPVLGELRGLSESLTTIGPGNGPRPTRSEVLQILLGRDGYHERHALARVGGRLAKELEDRRCRIAAAGHSLVEVEAQVRYAWIGRVMERASRRVRARPIRKTDLVDRVLTHRVAGMAVFLTLMAVCFQALYTWAAPLMDAIDGIFAVLGEGVASAMPEGALQSLVVNGVIAGVGAVLTFLPQILILFLFIAILEDCGYMARAAFLLDRWMGLLGLTGKSFIPLLSSFACAVPGIMATRTIEDKRDRLVTILIAPLMSCSARLPVYILLIGAFIPATPVLLGWMSLQAVVLLALYAVGVVVAVAAAFVLKRTVLKGKPSSFLLELPTYKWPSLGNVFFRVLEQGREFCVSAGTIIFAVTVSIWALGYYPHSSSIALKYDAERAGARMAFHAQIGERGAETDTAETSKPSASATSPEGTKRLENRLAEIDRAESGAYLRDSFLGRMGRFIEPAVRPLGWDWRIGTAAIAAFPAREVLIATMGTIYHLGEGADGSSAGLREKLREATWPEGGKVFNIPVALSIMVFFALCCQCGGTLAVIKRETGSWAYPVLTFTYMTGLAYVAALTTYQIGVRILH